MIIRLKMSNWEYGHACEHVTTEIPNLLLKNVQDKMKPKPNSERQQQQHFRKKQICIFGRHQQSAEYGYGDIVSL